jgi:Fe-S-cluster-containing hydrogenase component 2
MSDGQAPWVDHSICIGCATCVAVCPVDAIHIMNEKAHIDDEICTGCGACVDACPESAIQPVIEGEIVAVQERPVPALREPKPVAETGATAGAALAAAGILLLRNAADALMESVGRWLTQRSAGRAAESPPASGGARGQTGGHRARHRRRGP